MGELVAVFDGRSAFVEEQFIKLLNGLGLDTAAVALPAPLPFDVLRSASAIASKRWTECRITRAANGSCSPGRLT